MRGWIAGVACVASFVGIGAGLGLWVLGVPLPLTLGPFAGLLNVIPFAGSVLGGALATLVAFTISPLKAVEAAVLFLILNQIEDNILQPQVMGRQVRISTAVITVSFPILGTLLGPIIGAFLAVPSTVVVGWSWTNSRRIVLRWGSMQRQGPSKNAGPPPSQPRRSPVGLLPASSVLGEGYRGGDV
jgi:predicted PurR-regulated permease PerM